MPKRKATDEEIIEAYRRFGSPKRVADHLGISERIAYTRRTKLEAQGVQLPSFAAKQATVIEKHTTIPVDRRVITHEIENGTVVVGSDAHYWPGEATVAHKAFVEVIKSLKPRAVVMNGDVLDGARITRHDALFGSVTPTVRQEIEACQERLGEVENASKNSVKIWLYGNHDTRLWRYIHINAFELEGMVGTDLWADYFPGWHHGWRMDINDSVVIKHRLANGIHAAYNNTLRAGRTMVTGHLHRLCVTPWGDYNGRRWGVDTGCLADPTGEQFRYMEEAPTSGCSGFAVLTFKDGMLLPPELCEVIDGHAYFRGQQVV